MKFEHALEILRVRIKHFPADKSRGGDNYGNGLHEGFVDALTLFESVEPTQQTIQADAKVCPNCPGLTSYNRDTCPVCGSELRTA